MLPWQILVNEVMNVEILWLGMQLSAPTHTLFDDDDTAA
jgi:hypothetical protein